LRASGPGRAVSSAIRPGRNRSTRFPLSIHSSGRYLVDQWGVPFLMKGDAIWTIEVNGTNAQIDTYVASRVLLGFNTVMCECIEILYSQQSPAYNNVDGNAPFTTMSPTDFSSMVTAYWNRIDYLANQCLANGLLLLLFPAYLGFNGANPAQGWAANVDADTDAHLNTFGTTWANRYNQANVIPIALGDQNPDSTTLGKSFQIFGSSGILGVRPAQIVTAHSQRLSSAYAQLSTWLPFNLLNTIYCPKTGETDDLSATEYARTGSPFTSGSYPFFLIEDGYEGESGNTVANVRKSHWTSMLSGGSGVTSSNANWWPLGCAAGGAFTGTAAAALANYYNTPGTLMRSWAFALYEQYFVQSPAVPKTDTSLVSTALGTSGTAARTCPALGGNGQYALIWKNNTASITVVLSALSKVNLRVRWFDPSCNAFVPPAEGNAFTNSGSQAFAHPGNNSTGDTDWVLVID
jgi:Protein of unknown function (DUF4038)/Putative collagen-binding domain of a collagenase